MKFCHHKYRKIHARGMCSSCYHKWMSVKSPIYKEKLKLAQKRYEKKHRKKRREKARNKYHKNIEFYRKKRRKWLKKNYRKRNLMWVLKFRALQIISGKRIPCCIKCAEKDLRILTINHIGIVPKNEINRRNEINRINGKNRYWLYGQIVYGKRKVNDLEVRCHNCNILYEYEKGRLKNIKPLRKKALLIVSKRKQPICKKCKKKDLRLLNICHKNGTGNSSGKQKHIVYKRILKNGRKGFEIRCWNCNILYEYEQNRRFFNRKFIEKILKERKIIRMSDSLK